MFIRTILSVAFLSSVFAILTFSIRAIKRCSAATLLISLKERLDNKNFKGSLLKFGEFITLGTYMPAGEQYDVARLVLLCAKDGTPCFNIRFETVSMRGHYRCLISQDVPGFKWRTIGCRGRIGDAVWDAFVPLVDASTDVGLKRDRPKLTLIK